MFKSRLPWFNQGIKMLDFLDSDTPATKQWVVGYLKREGIYLSKEPLSVQNAKEMLIEEIASQEVFRLLVQKMGNAWRVRKHRHKKGTVSLSVELNKSVYNQLSFMSKGKTKAAFITEIIQQSYFSHQDKIALEKNIKRLTKDNKELETQLEIIKIENEKIYSELMLNRINRSSKQQRCHLLDEKESSDNIKS
ncbi:hypothetical protein [Shewanella algae]|uniref:hypothetical protein n=1 Tax=Shewanella algae TaxID=38313 RepID=UPI001AAD6C18|nr:hypothetical protein [Shewanella algae]MBO2687312.1 hypothetical protein [Shewanella algae]